MQNKNLNNSYPINEINLGDLFNLLINSKKTIIVITLICTLIATGYYYTREPMYQSNAFLVMGHYNEAQIQEDQHFSSINYFQSLDNLVTEINFYLEKDFEIVKKGNGAKFAELITSASSSELARNSMEEIIDYILDKSNKAIAEVKESDKLLLESFNSQISFIDLELQRMKKRIGVEERSTDSVNYVLASESELIIKLNQLQTLKNAISVKFADPNNYKNTKLYKEIETNQVHTTPTLIIFILLGSIAGFMLSILIVFIRQSFLQEQK